MPTRRETADGSPRRVGVEIELAGLEVDEIAAVIARELGGRVHPRHDYELTVSTPLGEFRVERDLELLKRWGRERAEATGEQSFFERVTHSAIESLAKQVAPCELVTPPLAPERIADVDRLAARLRELGARGTEDGLLYAFGVHFNPDAPSLEADDLLAHLRAFILLYPWMVRQLDVDLARRATPFIDPYPAEYALLVADPDYAPAMGQLIDDYLDYNPTRDRALDMLCLLAHLDRERVLGAVPDPRIHPRPTYHFRLPNSTIGDPSWHPSDGWRCWLLVEALAADPARLRDMGAAFCAELERPLGSLRSNWDQHAIDWVSDLGAYRAL